jgi:hypothetical protein
MLLLLLLLATPYRQRMHWQCSTAEADCAHDRGYCKERPQQPQHLVHRLQRALASGAV